MAIYATQAYDRQQPRTRAGQAAVEYLMLATAALIAALWLWNATPQLKSIWNGKFSEYVSKVNTVPGAP